MFNTLSILRNNLHIFSYKTWGGLHTPKARWLAYWSLQILARGFVEVLNF